MEREGRMRTTRSTGKVGGGARAGSVSVGEKRMKMHQSVKGGIKVLNGEEIINSNSDSSSQNQQGQPQIMRIGRQAAAAAAAASASATGGKRKTAVANSSSSPSREELVDTNCNSKSRGSLNQRKYNKKIRSTADANHDKKTTSCSLSPTPTDVADAVGAGANSDPVGALSEEICDPRPEADETTTYSSPAPAPAHHHLISDDNAAHPCNHTPKAGEEEVVEPPIDDATGSGQEAEAEAEAEAETAALVPATNSRLVQPLPPPSHSEAVPPPEPDLEDKLPMPDDTNQTDQLAAAAATTKGQDRQQVNKIGNDSEESEIKIKRVVVHNSNQLRLPNSPNSRPSFPSIPNNNKPPLNSNTNTNTKGGTDFRGIPETHTRLQSLVDLVMWADVSKSAFVFGFGSFLIISSSYTKDLNISLISVASYLGLVYLAIVFLYKSIICRGVMYIEDSPQDCVLGEEEVIWVVKLVLPYLNEFLLQLRSLFCGDPAVTMKMALMLFVLARCGSSITIWKTLKLGFFGVFVIPKVCASYSTQIAAYGKFWVQRIQDAWKSCSHKKAVAFAIFSLIWNFSSVVARAWAAFMLLVAFRYYQQFLIAHESDEDQAISHDLEQRHIQRYRRRIPSVEQKKKIK